MFLLVLSRSLLFKVQVKSQLNQLYTIQSRVLSPLNLILRFPFLAIRKSKKAMEFSSQPLWTNTCIIVGFYLQDDAHRCSTLFFLFFFFHLVLMCFATMLKLILMYLLVIYFFKYHGMRESCFLKT